jgi:hypothetical protein
MRVKGLPQLNTDEFRVYEHRGPFGNMVSGGTDDFKGGRPSIRFCTGVGRCSIILDRVIICGVFS